MVRVGRTRGLRFAALACTGALMACAAAPAQATFPGANGPFVFDRASDSNLGSGNDEFDDEICLLPQFGPGFHCVGLQLEPSAPAVSPDGRSLAFSDDRPRINVRPTGRGHGRPVTHPPSGAKDGLPAWAPDGRQIAFDRVRRVRGVPSFEVWSKRLGTRRGRPLVAGYQPEWSTRDKLAFLRFRNPRALDCSSFSPSDCQGSKTDLWTSRSDGKGARRIALDAYDPDWSPDGRRLAYMRRNRIHSCRANGTHDRVLHVRARIRGERTSPTWSPDGRTLAFLRSRQIIVVRLDGTVVRRIGLGRYEDPTADSSSFSNLDWAP